jgi:copper chaperone CopZ
MSIVIAVEGMTCGGCVSAVRNALARAGVATSAVEVGRATVEPGADEAETVARARAAIERAGFVPGPVSRDTTS